MPEKYIKGFVTTGDVTIHKTLIDPAKSLRVINHSPTGFNWGYPGSGPSQLALAILLHFRDKQFALNNYYEFRREFIEPLDQNDNFEIPISKVMQWIAGRDTMEE